MADVFISYKSEDRAAAKLFAEALAAEGVSVWWDPVLRTGETYDEVIERNLRESALVVVLWSPRSVKSKWVRAEATIGERKGGLLPVLIEACERPIAFELVQTADLAGWAGDRSDARWLDLMADLRNALTARAAQVQTHTAPPPPDPLTIETLFWSSIKDGGDAADFESYLQRYPHGQFADLARTRLARPAHEPAAAKGALFDVGRYVFVSYPTDIAPALLIAVVRELLGRGLSIWLYDPSAYAFTPEEKARLRWQQAGGSWERQTLDAIRGASAVIALVNEYSLQSRFQPREFKLAAQEKKLLPCIIGDLDYKALPPVFRDMHAPKITADMVGSDIGSNRIAMLASDAEALISRPKSKQGAVLRPAASHQKFEVPLTAFLLLLPIAFALASIQAHETELSPLIAASVFLGLAARWSWQTILVALGAGVTLLVELGLGGLVELGLGGLVEAGLVEGLYLAGDSWFQIGAGFVFVGACWFSSLVAHWIGRLVLRYLRRSGGGSHPATSE